MQKSIRCGCSTGSDLGSYEWERNDEENWIGDQEKKTAYGNKGDGGKYPCAAGVIAPDSEPKIEYASKNQSYGGDFQNGEAEDQALVLRGRLPKPVFFSHEPLGLPPFPFANPDPHSPRRRSRRIPLHTDGTAVEATTDGCGDPALWTHDLAAGVTGNAVPGIGGLFARPAAGVLRHVLWFYQSLDDLQRAAASDGGDPGVCLAAYTPPDPRSGPPGAAKQLQRFSSPSLRLRLQKLFHLFTPMIEQRDFVSFDLRHVFDPGTLPPSAQAALWYSVVSVSSYLSQPL